MARPRGRDVSTQLGRCAARKLGAPDRGDEVTAHRRRSRWCSRGRALGARRRCGGLGEPDRPLCRLAREPRAGRGRRRCGARHDAFGRGGDSACSRRLARGARRVRCVRVRELDPRARRRLRGTRGVPRRHRGRRHGARAAGTRLGARTLGRAHVAAPAGAMSSRLRPTEATVRGADLRQRGLRDRRRRAPGRAPSQPGWRSGMPRARRRSRARGSRRSSCRPAT